MSNEVNKISNYNQMMSWLTRPEPPKTQVASAETDALKEKFNEELGPGTIKTLDELPPIQDPFKNFEDKNPRETAAQGGVIGEGGMFRGQDLGTREGFQKLKKTYTKYEDGKDYDKLKPATEEEQLKIKEEYIKRYDLFKKGKIGIEELYPKMISKVVYNLPEVNVNSDFTKKTKQFLKTLDTYKSEIAPQLKSVSAGLGKKKAALADLGYTGQKGVAILRDLELRAEVKKLVEKDNLPSRSVSKILQDKYPNQKGLSLTQVKGAIKTLVEEGDISADKVRPAAGAKLTGEEAVERTKILKNLILNTNLNVADIQKKVISPLGGETSRKVILDVASDLLSDKQLAKRFKTISDDFISDVKVIDKLVKKSNIQKVINDETLSKRDRFRFLAEEFSKKVKKPIGSVLGQFNNRLTALGSVYSGSKYYDTESLDKVLVDSITPIKNFNNSNLQKNLLGINASIKGLNNIDTARMIGISNENIDILRKTQKASKGAFPGFVLQGDHTDIKSLMSNFDNYKDNFMRIQFIQKDLNLFKSSYDREILRLFDLAKKGETIDPKTNLPINDAVQNKVQEFKTKTGGYDLGEFSVDKQGNFKIDPKTPIISDLDAPINQTLKQTALNLEKYSSPEGEKQKLKNKFDQEYLSVETGEQREDVLEKYKNSKVIQKSNILKGMAEVPGPIGKAAKIFLAGGAVATPFIIPTIANADTDEDMFAPVDPGVIVPQENKKETTKENNVNEPAIAGGAALLGIYGPGLLKGALKTIGSPTAATLLSSTELFESINPFNKEGEFLKLKEDPSYSKAGIELLLPEIGKAIPKGSSTGIMSRIGSGVLNPFQYLDKLKKFGKVGRIAAMGARAPSMFTPLGIGLQGVELVNQAMKEQDRIDTMRENDPEMYQEYLQEQEDMSRESAANGGIMTLRKNFADGPDNPKKKSLIKKIPKVGKILQGLDYLKDLLKKKTITVKRGESGTAGASGADSNPDYRGKYYTPEGGGFGTAAEDARYYSKLGGDEGNPKVFTAELTPEEIKEGLRLRSLDSQDPEIGDIILPKSAEDKVKIDYLNTIRAQLEKYLKMADGGRVNFADGPDDPSKRKFIKIAGGLASIPIVGRFFDVASQAPKVAEAVKRTAEGVPEFLMDLIAKVKLKAKTKGFEYFTGNKPEEFTDVYKVDNYVVTEQGNKTIIREIDKDGDMLYKENQIEIETDPETGGVTYREASARPDGEGKLKDVEEYIEDADLENMKKYTYDE